MSPTGFVEAAFEPMSLDPSGLPAPLRASLQALATGRNEPIGATVQAIAEFFVDAEDERAEGPLLDALDWYLANYVYA